MSTERIMILHKGFEDIQRSTIQGGAKSPSIGRLQWYCAPDSWGNAGSGTDTTGSKTRRKVADGRWHVTDLPSSSSFSGDVASSRTRTTTQLTIYPPAKKDFWRKTYYKPMLVKDDGPFLFYALPMTRSNKADAVENNSSSSSGEEEYCYYTIETSFRLTAVCQFDQAGLMIRLDARHWLKTGIEVVDGKARLSCVVTNIYSDWSTQPWPCIKTTTTTTTATTNTSTDCSEEYTLNTENVVVDAVRVECQIRIHCRGTSFVVEAKHPPTAESGQKEEEDDEQTWEFLRIAHLSTNMIRRGSTATSSAGEDDDDSPDDGFLGPAPDPGAMWVGVFACCPEDQRGGHATFTHFQVQSGSTFDHNADGNFDS
jgi:regulation of enolase protein 1 (concanavalin A-like superfamily)